MCRSGKSLSCSWALMLVCFLQFTDVLHLRQTHAANQICAPSSCGKLANIRHPFRLKDDPSHCGDPRYELGCEDNVTVLSLFSGKYHVQAINYNNFTIRLVDPGIQEDNISSIPSYFLSSSNFTDSYDDSRDNNADPYFATQARSGDIDDFSGLIFTSPPGPSYVGKKTMFQHVIYLECSNPVKDDPRYVDTAPSVNWDSKQSHVYAIAGDLLAGILRVDCHVRLVATTSFLGLVRNREKPLPYNKSFSYNEIHRRLVSGFDVSWMNRACEGYCSAPEDLCYFNATSGELKCKLPSCKTPLGSTLTRCGNMSKLRIFAEDYVYGTLKGLRQVVGTDNGDPYYNVDISERSIRIGVLTGRYVVPYITVRFTLGVIVFSALLIYTCRRKHASNYENIEDFLRGNTLMPIRYSYKDIKKMTTDFKDKLGKGGYGSVYKGKLRSGPFVAVKMLNKSKIGGQEFISEVATLGRIHHYNVVRLIGFCVERSKRALVYEFMPNGSLDKYAFFKEDSVSLTYEKMFEISLGVTRGIAYLHQGCDMQILHFDIKPHNILLDENFIPKVSDFGLAKLYPIDNSIVTMTAARGTIGYIAPELFYKNIGKVSCKADVYSFGMLLMEMASRRKNLNSHVEHSSQLYFPFWIYDKLIEENKIEMEDVINEERNNLVKKMFMVALWCIQLNPSDRPSMNKVIEMLEGEVQNIEIPPKPSLYPHETIQMDDEINSDKTTSDDLTGSSNLEDTITDPLIRSSGC